MKPGNLCGYAAKGANSRGSNPVYFRQMRTIAFASLLLCIGRRFLFAVGMLYTGGMRRNRKDVFDA